MNLGYEDAKLIDMKVSVTEAYEKETLEESSVDLDFYKTLETAVRMGGNVVMKYDDKKPIKIDPDLGKYLLFFFKTDKNAINDAARGTKIDFVHALSKAMTSPKFNSFKP